MVLHIPHHENKPLKLEMDTRGIFIANCSINSSFLRVRLLLAPEDISHVVLILQVHRDTHLKHS